MKSGWGLLWLSGFCKPAQGAANDDAIWEEHGAGDSRNISNVSKCATRRVNGQRQN